MAYWPDLDEFTEHLEQITGYEGDIYKLTEEGEEPPLWVVIYDDVPDEGSITAFTYGLSLGTHPDWEGPRPELMLSVESTNVDWGFALGVLAKSLRGKCPFQPGNVVKFGERVGEDSEMSAFVAYHPTVLEEDQIQFEVEDRPLQFVQLFPIYEDEIPVLEKIGVEAFFENEELDPYNLRRPKMAV